MSTEHQKLLSELNKFRDHANKLREHIRNRPPRPQSATRGGVQVVVNVMPPPATDPGKELEDAIDTLLGKIGVYEVYLQAGGDGELIEPQVPLSFKLPLSRSGRRRRLR